MLTKNIFLLSLSAFFADSGYQAIIAWLPLFIVMVLKAPVYFYGIAMAFAYGGGSFFEYIGGGLTASVYFMILLYYHAAFKFIFLVSLPLLLLSTFPLLLVDYKKNTAPNKPAASNMETAQSGAAPEGGIKTEISDKYKKSTFRGIIIATSLYGFSAYSLGFPILTISQKLGYITGIGGYALLSIVSAFTGYYIGSSNKSAVGRLSILGYMGAATGSFILGYAYIDGFGVPVFYIWASILGFSLGVIETLEPTIISFIAKDHEIGIKMGSLTAARSVGLFFGNLLMGVLYLVSPIASYGYVAFVAMLSGIPMLFFGRNYKNS